MTKVYFANGLFSEADKDYNVKVVKEIRERFKDEDLSIYLPQENFSINDKQAYADSITIAKADNAELKTSDVLFAVLDGISIDAGVASEIGIAHERGIPIIAIYTDTRQEGGDNTKKINALNDIAESQFSYVNLYTVGLVKMNGRVVNSTEKAINELEFLVEAIKEFKESKKHTQFTI